MPYSMQGWIESLKPRKEGCTTYLANSISREEYGWIFKLGPLVIVNIDGFYGERIRALKIFRKEWQW